MSRLCTQIRWLVRLEALLEPAKVRGHFVGRLAADDEGTSSLPMPCPSNSSSILTRDCTPPSRGSTVTFTIARIGPSLPWPAQLVGVARVKELDGEANDPAPIPGMGWFATCKDPHGNDFGLWQTDPSAPAPTA